MPARLSKFFIHANCKEYAHPWSDSCVSTTAGLGLHALQDSLRIYSTLYIIALLSKGRFPTKDDIKKTILSIAQSTAFLSWSAFTYSMFICTMRRLIGNFNILTVSFLPSFFSSLAAIILERSSRRTMLCLYVSNIATEVLFRMAVSRGYLSVIPKGEIYIFAAGMAILLYFFKTNKNSSDSVFKIIRFAIGQNEQLGYCRRNYSLSQSPSERTANARYQNSKIPKPMFYIIWQSLRLYKEIIDKIKSYGSHASCPHSYSCVHYMLKGGLRMFSFGVTAQLLLKLIFNIKKLITRTKTFNDVFFKKSNLNLALFLGGFTGLYKLVSCCLRRILNHDSPNIAIIAGLVASISFSLYPDNTIALYVLWKALQLSWNNGVEKGKVPKISWFVIFLYCFSTAVLFHAAIVEPNNLRLSYWKFLYNLSGGRIAMMSRIPIDEFGLSSNKHLQNILLKTNTHNKHIYSF